MSSNMRREQFNTRERALSTDLNDMTAYLHRNIIEAVRQSHLGQDLPNTAGGSEQVRTSGVIAGFRASVTGADLNVTIHPGQALKYNAAALSTDSLYDWFEQIGTQVFDLTALVDPGNPRWVCIEIDTSSAPASPVVSSQARDIFDPGTGAFSPSVVTKVTGPGTPVLVANAATPAATPLLPVGATDRIPLCYVYLDAATVTIATTDVVLCRPMLRKEMGDPGERVTMGGGVNVGAVGDEVEVLQIRGDSGLRGPGPWALQQTGAIDMTVEGQGGLLSGSTYPPASPGPMYCVVASPPYPAGYDADLGPESTREVKPLGGFGLSPAPFALADDNCVLFFTFGDPTGVGEDLDGDFGVVTPASTQWAGGTSEVLAYAGAASYFGTSPAVINSLGKQQYIGKGKVVMDDGNVPFELDTQTSTSSGNTTGNYRNSEPLNQGGDVVLPLTAFAAMIACAVSPLAGSASDMRLYDYLSGFGDVPTFTTASWAVVLEPTNAAVIVGAPELNSPGSSVGAIGDFGWNHTEGNGVLSSVQFFVRGYVDQILARR